MSDSWVRSAGEARVIRRSVHAGFVLAARRAPAPDCAVVARFGDGAPAGPPGGDPRSGDVVLDRFVIAGLLAAVSSLVCDVHGAADRLRTRPTPTQAADIADGLDRVAVELGRITSRLLHRADSPPARPILRDVS